jgi:L-threonylcarbamoyladenylate synthase
VLPDSPDSFAVLARVLAEGGVAIAPGDTMYGLVGAVPVTEERLRLIKGRGEEKPFIRLIAEASWLPMVTAERLPDRLARHWPGPLTIVLPGREGGTVAVRVPDHDLLRRLLLAVGRPLFSTSVNRAGSPPLSTVEQMCREFEGDVDVIYDAGDRPPGPPSTLLDATVRPFRILRQGAVAIDPADLGLPG